MNTKLVNAAAGVIAAAMEQGKQLPATLAIALESAQLLQSPETAAELERLRAYAKNRQVREEELLAAMGRYDLSSSPDAWDLGMTVLAHLEGPLDRSTPEEREPGLRALTEQLRTRVAELEALLREATAGTAVADDLYQHLQRRVAELEAQLAAKDRPVDEDPIAYALTDKAEDAMPPVKGDTVRLRSGAEHVVTRTWTSGSDLRVELDNGLSYFAATVAIVRRADVTPEVRKLRALLAGQRAALEDPHDSPLHHKYKLGRDLPETGGAS